MFLLRVINWINITNNFPNMEKLPRKKNFQNGKQFRKYFYCFCLAEALLAEAEVEKTPTRSHGEMMLTRELNN